jgi:hypothetical protein
MDRGTGQSSTKKMELLMKDGLYANIHRKRARIKAGSGEKMNKPGSKGAPTAKDFKESAKTSRREMIASKMKDM